MTTMVVSTRLITHATIDNTIICTFAKISIIVMIHNNEQIDGGPRNRLSSTRGAHFHFRFHFNEAILDLEYKNIRIGTLFVSRIILMNLGLSLKCSCLLRQGKGFYQD